MENTVGSTYLDKIEESFLQKKDIYNFSVQLLRHYSTNRQSL